jgi:hypothetical protein
LKFYDKAFGRSFKLICSINDAHFYKNAYNSF